MDSVYRDAGRVVIWLGEEDETTADVFDLLEALYDVVPRSFDSYPILVKYETLSASGLPRHNDKRWRALEAMLSNSWFSRTWVLQEASVNTRTWIQQGSHSIEWSRLLHIILCICAARVDIRYNINLAASHYMAHFCASVIAAPSAWPLVELLQNTQWTSSSKDVDKVFGLVGLASDQQTVKHLIDYTRDAQSLYTQVALTYLLKGEMKLLNLASDPSFSQFRHLPTWVPDWSTWPRASPLAPQISHLRAHEGRPPPRRPARLPTLSPDGARLTVSAHFADRVVAIGRHLPLLRYTDRGIAFLFLEPWRRLAHEYLAESTNGRTIPLDLDLDRDLDININIDTIDDAFARLLTFECPLPRLASDSYTRTYTRYLQHCLRHRHWQQPSSSSSSGPQDPQPDAQRDLFQFRDRMLISCRKRTFFITEQGFMGLGPFFLRPGDRVVGFEGVGAGTATGTPMAVRRRTMGIGTGKGVGRWELVGEMYIQGMMKGEGDEAGWSWEDLCLV
ncbi:hypothetical protein B0A55_00485 [Friedmanniomyces simplex]|uniref:Heterokaryon incompatibility domain-containing protein n=1 Tax=Friedmanniomyces simplex TaxID=329884 RepID=A0A4U0Y0B2_9PEZI|nr:hypothetical protein B0A55_00485 [Friedmanniomyces simplex]